MKYFFAVLSVLALLAAQAGAFVWTAKKNFESGVASRQGEIDAVARADLQKTVFDLIANGERLQNDIQELQKINDDSVCGRSVSVAFDRLRRNRSAE